MTIRTYSELRKLKTFKDRFNYLVLDGNVGDVGFGFDRYLNQKFYRSAEWKQIRREVILRDNGCDLGLAEYPIRGHIYVHHMNPITKFDLINRTDYLLNPEYMISVCYDTHQAITYGLEDYEKPEIRNRRPNDTCPWK